MRLLEEKGFETWAVGGCVRDALLGREIYDIDLTTQAHWEQVGDILTPAGFSCHETGVKYGTITAVIDEVPLEITTFRSEGTYSDNRHPDAVAFTLSIEEDLARRDLTINAMAFHPTRGIFDPFKGQEDLASGIIRTVGEPAKRFSEDALRILRALRFASSLQFTLEDATAQAILQCGPLLASVHPQRLRRELDGLLTGAAAPRVLREYLDVLGVLIPELLPLRDFDQRCRFHRYDALEHTARVLGNVPEEPRIRWAALLHDIEKPSCLRIDSKGCGHFAGHPKAGADTARKILTRLMYPSRFIDEVCGLVRYHDTQIPLTEAGVCRMLLNLDLRGELFIDLVNLKIADERGKGLGETERLRAAKQLPGLLRQARDNNHPCHLGNLNITGSDLLQAGFTPGPAIGNMLRTLLYDCIDEKVENDRDALLKYAKELQDKGL
ncbi:MAG: CCA tRNA nucleotidyltransferase [Eggerthellaceae bacterium]